MGWDLNALVNLIADKFLKEKMIDVNTRYGELETVKKAIEALNKFGVKIEKIEDIPKLWHIMFYHDDEYASKLISGEDDQMQTARATLFSLTGDCEDIHRLYQIAAIAIGEKPENAKLMILFFGDKEKITGGHATALIIHKDKYINLDYNYLVVADDIKGILQYHKRYANPVAYLYLTVDKRTLHDDVIKYMEKIDAFYAPNGIGSYVAYEIPEDEKIKALKKHLHRSAERDTEDRTKQIIFSLGLLAGGILIGGMIR